MTVMDVFQCHPVQGLNPMIVGEMRVDEKILKSFTFTRQRRRNLFRVKWGNFNILIWYTSESQDQKL